MNSLTANLHLMMVSFYRPTRERPAILIEKSAFPSDRYAVESQIRFHGFDPADGADRARGDEPGGTISHEAILRAIDEHGERIALVLLPGVQYLSGQVFDLARDHPRRARARAAWSASTSRTPPATCTLKLHDSGCDFAVWCSYKYLNAGPGAVAGCFVHERHARADLPRFAGWWGHDPASRFQMGPEFVPTPGADGWQLSNPPILALAPLRVSLGIFHRAGMAALRAKSDRADRLFRSADPHARGRRARHRHAARTRTPRLPAVAARERPARRRPRAVRPSARRPASSSTGANRT